VFTIEVAELANGQRPIQIWLRKQPSSVQVIVAALVEELLAHYGPAICRSEFGKALGKGLFELRARQTPRTLFARFGRDVPKGFVGANEEVLVRVFFAVGRDKTIVLLGGLNKKKQNSEKAQRDAILRARRVWEQYRSMNR